MLCNVLYFIQVLYKKNTSVWIHSAPPFFSALHSVQGQTSWIFKDMMLKTGNRFGKELRLPNQPNMKYILHYVCGFQLLLFFLIKKNLWISICVFRGSCELSRLNNRQNHLAQKVMITHWTIPTCCSSRCFWFKETYSTVIVGTSWQADCQVLNEIDPANSIRKEYQRQWYSWACASDICVHNSCLYCRSIVQTHTHTQRRVTKVLVCLWFIFVKKMYSRYLTLRIFACLSLRS